MCSRCQIRVRNHKDQCSCKCAAPRKPPQFSARKLGYKLCYECGHYVAKGGLDRYV
jgi:hypothetical protein